MNFIEFVKNNQKEIFKCIVNSSKNKPEEYNERTNRFKIPYLLEADMKKNKIFSDIKFIERQGKTYDWLYKPTHEKISVKTLSNGDYLPRPNKKDNQNYTFGKQVIIKNLQNNNGFLKNSDFDYLMLIINDNNNDIYEIYIYHILEIQKHIQNTGATISFRHPKPPININFDLLKLNDIDLKNIFNSIKIKDSTEKTKIVESCFELECSALLE